MFAEAVGINCLKSCLLEGEEHKVTINHIHILLCEVIEQYRRDIFYILAIVFKTWAVVVFCPLPLGKSEKFAAIKNTENSQGNAKMHI